MWRIGILLIAASCGRLGFDDHAPSPSSGTPDAPGSTTQPPDASGIAAQLLTCGSPTRFTITADNTGFASTPRTNGFGVFDVDSQGALWGWSYDIVEGGLDAKAESIQLGSNTNSSLGGAAVGDQFVIATGNPGMSPGETVYALDSKLDAVSTPSSTTGETPGQVPLAANGSTLAYATIEATGDADIRLLDSNGGDASNAQIVDAASDMPSYAQVLATSHGFAFGYGLGNGLVQIATFDVNLNSLVGPTNIDANTDDMRSPELAYSPTLDQFAIAWHQKDVTNDDDIWATIVDGELNVVVAPFEVAPYSTNAVLASDASGFWIAYDTYDPMGMKPDAMAASHVDATGTVTSAAITSSGGSPASWQLIERAGQVVLVWAESGGSGPNLYFDPMCNGG